MPEKIVFLDIDGVICLYPPWQYDWRGNENTCLDEACCKNLKAILDETGAKIVLTSSWRLSIEFLRELYEKLQPFNIGVEYIAGQTEDFSKPGISHNKLRWTEINDYIERNNIEKYIIIDDFNLEKYDKNNFVRTKRHEGLTASLKKVCINKLNS